MQQPEQERCPDQSGDHANGDTNRAGNGIGKEQEERSADRREGQHGARVRANREARQVRHNEANKADQAGEGNRRGGGEGGKGNGDTSLTAHINAEMCRPLITEQEGGEGTAASGEKERGEGNWNGGGGEAWPGHTVETTEQEAEDCAQVCATREHHQRECGGEQRGDSVADEQHAGDALFTAPDASDAPDERHRGERANECGELHATELPGDAGDGHQEGDRGTERRAATGLRSSDWNAAPEVASAAPTAIAARIRGRRISITIEVAPALMSLPTGSPKRLFPMIASTSSGAMFATPKPIAPIATTTSAESERSVVLRITMATEGSLDATAQ